MATTMAPERKTGTQPQQDERPFTLGSVWSVQLIRVKPGHGIEYARELAAKDKKLFEELKKEGLVLSYKILRGPAASRDDFDTIFLVEYPNYAALDHMEKYDAIRQRVLGSLSQEQENMQKRAEIRESIGGKLMQEIHLK